VLCVSAFLGYVLNLSAAGRSQEGEGQGEGEKDESRSFLRLGLSVILDDFPDEVFYDIFSYSAATRQQSSFRFIHFLIDATPQLYTHISRVNAIFGIHRLFL
jgi:hypothetical protein